MIAQFRRDILTLVVGLASINQATSAVLVQEKSVRPGINKSFKDPDVQEFIQRFEWEGREVFDKRKEIVAACKLKPGMVIADIGAGTGLFTRLLSPVVGPHGRVYAVDIAKKFLDHIQKTCKQQDINNVTGVVCTQFSVKLPPRSIDVAFICDVYHHFEFPHKTMRSIHRALRPGGQVILIEFHRIEGESSDWVLEHVRAGQETFAKEIVRAGFRLVEEQKFMKTSYFLRFAKSAQSTATGHTKDSLETVRQLISQKKAVLIDVREEDEWDAGHLEAAMRVPLSDLGKLAQSNELAAQLANTLPKQKIIYCHCRSGGRALVAAKILVKLGYEVRPLKAGYSDLLKAGFAKAKKERRR